MLLASNFLLVYNFDILSPTPLCFETQSLIKSPKTTLYGLYIFCDRQFLLGRIPLDFFRNFLRENIYTF